MLIVDICTAIAAAVLVLLPLGELLLAAGGFFGRVLLEEAVIHIPAILDDLVDDDDPG